MKMGKLKKAVLVVILYIVDFVITGFTTIYVWNNVICKLFALRTFTFWQGWAFAFALTYFIPHKWSKDKEKDLIETVLADIIYTLFIWLLMFLAVKFITF